MPSSILAVVKSAKLCLRALFTCAVGLAFSSGVLLAADALPLTPTQISQQIEAHGATSVVSQLDQQGQYDDLMDKISAGKPEWITLAPELAKGTDAGTSEELSISLALALPINPEAVLKVLNARGVTPLSTHEICSAPFVEDTVKDIPAYITRSIKAVELAKDITVKEQQMACLAELHQAATMPTYNP